MKKVLTAFALALLPVVAAAQTAPDFIITNAKIWSGDPAVAGDSIAITGDRITAIGKKDSLLATADHRTRIIDAKQHLVIPGFNDAEVIESPQPADIFRLSLNPNATWGEARAAIEAAVDETPESPWILGTIGAKAMNDPDLTAAALDRASHNRKVILMTADGLGAVASGVAMQVLHVDPTDLIGGAFERDASGRMTGRMRGYAAFAVRRRFADAVSDAEAADEMQRFVNEALRNGVTSIQNISFLSAKKYERLLRHTSPQLRIRMIRFPMTTASGLDLDEGAGLVATNPERPLAPINGWTWFLEDAAGTTVTPLQLQSFVKAAWDAPEQTVFHANGSETIATLFSAMRAAGAPEQWRAKRIAIAGAHELTGELIPPAKEFGIVAIVRPSDPVAKALIAAGVPVAFGTGDDPSPFHALAQATAITRAQALDAMTRGAAFAENADGQKGTLTPGKLADLAILSTDVLDGSPAGAQSLLTMLNGKIAFDSHVLPQGRKD